MKLGHNVCFDEISNKFKNGSCQVKTRSLGQMLEETCVCSRGHIFSLIIMKLDQHIGLDEISDQTIRKALVSDSRAIMDLLLTKTVIFIVNVYFTPVTLVNRDEKTDGINFDMVVCLMCEYGHILFIGYDILVTRCQMSSIMDLLGPELSELSAVELENLPYLTLFIL